MSLQLLLRQMRSRKRISQLELALRLGVSQRHVSFVELGRTQPSRGLLTAWLEAVEAPGSIRNAAMITAGYAIQECDMGTPARPDAASWPELSQVIQAHDPFPGLIFTSDRYMCEMNEGTRRMWALLMPNYWKKNAIDGAAFDMIAAIASPDGLLSQMPAPALAAARILYFLRTEEWLKPVLKTRIDAMEQALIARYGVLCAPENTQHASAPMCTFDFATEVGKLSFVLTQSTVGLPQDIRVASPRLELWFAANPSTRELVQRMARTSLPDGQKIA